jgi:hypothetical protein
MSWPVSPLCAAQLAHCVERMGGDGLFLLHVCASEGERVIDMIVFWASLHFICIVAFVVAIVEDLRNGD